MPQNEVTNEKLHLKAQQHERINHFLVAIQYLKNDDEDQITINDVVKRMEGNLGSSSTEYHAYSEQYMKQKVTELLGDNIIFTNIKGRINVVTVQASSSSILRREAE